MPRPTGYEPLSTLKPIAEDVWISDGGWIRFYGLPFPTRMTVIRLPGSRLWVHSPIEPAKPLLDSLAKLGEVKYLIAPNWIHYAWITEWQKLFPEAVTWASPGVVDRARSRGTSLFVDHELTDLAPQAWQEHIQQRVADSKLHKEVIFFHTSTRTLVLTDLIENFERKFVPWWMRPLLKLGQVGAPDGRTPRDIATSFRRSPKHLTELIETMITWDPERVVISHGRWFEKNGTAEIRRAFRTELKR